MEEDKESLQPQEPDGQKVTDSVTDETAETAETAGVVAAPDAEQSAGKRGSAIEKAKVTLLAVIAACLVTIVIQNFFPTEREVRGYVTGETYVRGGSVGVFGTVSVDNLSDISLSMPSSTRSYGYPWSVSPIDVRIVGCSRTLDVNIEEVNGRYVGSGIPVRVE